MQFLPSPLLCLLYLSLTSAAAAASPSPPFVETDFAMSLIPRNTLFYRQVKDLQTFSGALGGVRASSIMNSGIPDRPFQVENSNFPDFASAAQRSCDEQFDGCQQMANQMGNGNGNANTNAAKGKGKAARDDKPFTVSMCQDQRDKCKQAQQKATVQDFTPVASTNIGPDPMFPDFDLICEG